MNTLKFFAMTLIFLATSMLFGCGQEEPEQEEIIRPVRYEQIFLQGGNRVRTFSGVAKASEESRLSFKVPGTVERLAVQVGDNVQAGQLIAELNDEDYRLQKQQAEASNTQAQATARNARANYERVKLLYESNNASRSELDGARANKESAEAAEEATQKQLELANLQLSYTELRAPTDGAIATVNVEVNENVAAGQTIVQLTSIEGLEVEVTIPEILITQIQEGDAVTVGFDALPEQEFPATVTEVGISATGMGSTYPVTVLLDEENPDVRSGMAAEVGFNFESQDQQEYFVVPSVAVAEDRKGRHVFVVKDMGDGFGTIERKDVRIGDLTSDGIEVLEGLNDGDKVVTAGVSRIHEGQKVRVN